MTNPLYDELAMAATATDSSANAAWLQVALRQELPSEAARAEAWWQAATEEEQAYVGVALGWLEPAPRERKCPIYGAVMRDFHKLAARANDLLDFAEQG